ncbi:MAG: metal ABC transporter permease [Coriobacteriales bacterium]|jgi:zinc transport system permease protein|nr:metal ABC transporter permease [Coriobacteriales bacterium]
MGIIDALLDTVGQFLSYTFLLRALVVGLLVSLCASVLGVSLVLKRFSMIGDGLSHVGFGSLAVATAFGWAPLAVSLPVVMAAAFLLLWLSERGRIKGDAAIALISASALAIGVFVVSMSTGMNTDVDNYLFGSILALTHEDVVLSVALSLVVLVVFSLFYHKIFAVTFDEPYARATGIPVGFYNAALALLTALTIVVGMRMMGALLISSLVIFPALSSMWVCRRFSAVTVSAALVSVVCYLVGLFVSFTCQAPAGASIVLANLVAFLVFYALHRLRRMLG